MATTTTHYGLVKPGVNDYVDISVLNANYDNLDNVIYNNLISALENLAPEYDATATYSVGDYVTYNKDLYRCITAIATAEAFDDTKWTAVKVGGELKSHDERISDLEAGVELEGEATNSFDDGIDSYFKKVVSTIVPVQAGSGTPSPNNERAISGFTECTVNDDGKNLLNNIATTRTINNVTFTVNNDKTVLVNTNPSASALTQITLASISLKKGVTYTLSGCPIGGGGSSYSLNVVGVTGVFPQAIDTGSGVTFTPNTDVTTSINIIVYNGATVSDKTFLPMLRLASETDATYTPYVSPTTATISFGAAGTVYDATVDLISGKLVVEWGYLAPTEIVQINQSGTTYYWLVSSAINSVNGGEGSVKSSHFKSEFGASAGNTYITGNGHALMAVPTDQSLNTKALADAWLQANNPQFIYKLATPQEYQLTPAQLRSLIGANRLTSSTGEVTEVEYIKNKTIAWLLDLIRA